MQASYGNCLARKYLFGLWKGARNPLEFFYQVFIGDSYGPKNCEVLLLVSYHKFFIFVFSLFIRKMYVKRRGVRWTTNSCRRCILHQKGEMMTMLTRALLGHSAEHSQALLDMRFCTPSLGRAVFLPR